MYSMYTCTIYTCVNTMRTYVVCLHVYYVYLHYLYIHTCNTFKDTTQVRIACIHLHIKYNQIYTHHYDLISIT